VPKSRLVSALTHVHVAQLKSACVRVNFGARNQPMHAERKIVNGTWQRAFFRDKRSHSCNSEPLVRCRTMNKQALTIKNKGWWVLAEENPGYHIWPSESFPCHFLWTSAEISKICSFENVYWYNSVSSTHTYVYFQNFIIISKNLS